MDGSVKVFSQFSTSKCYFYYKEKRKLIPLEWKSDEISYALMSRIFQFWTSKKKFSCLEKYRVFREPSDVIWKQWFQYDSGSLSKIKC